MNQPLEAADRVRSVFDRVVGDGLSRNSVEGASDAQIDRMAANQGVARVPATVREVLRLMGVQSGLWLAGTAFGVNAMTGERKRHAIATVNGLQHDMADPGRLLVLSAHQGYAYHVIDGADLDQDDPPVWDVVEGEHARQAWNSVSAWFRAIAPNVRDMREQLELMVEMGKRLPSWARYVELRSE